jgi:hypothetical protein
LTYRWGYGALSAGDLDATKGDKAFGTLGQGSSGQFGWTPGGGMVNTWTNPNQVSEKYMAVTFLPNVNNTNYDKEAGFNFRSMNSWMDYPEQLYVNGTYGDW